MELKEKSTPKCFIFNNLIFDGIGDILLTIGFIPYVITFLSITEYLPYEFYADNMDMLNVLLTFGKIALLFFLFTSIAAFKNRDRILKSGIYYFILGTIFYTVELVGLLIMKYAVLSDNELLEQIVEVSLPLNYLYSISAFLFLGFFLLCKPKKINTKVNLIAFRLLSIIPLAYIFSSYVFSILSSAEIYDLPIELSIFFSGQYFLQEVFGLILIFIIFTIDLINKRRISEGKEELSPSQLKKNIIVCSILLVMAVVDWILTYCLPLDTVTYYELGTIKYAIFFIPLFFLYRNDDSETEYKKTFFFLDWYYTMIMILLTILYVSLLLAKGGAEILI